MNNILVVPKTLENDFKSMEFLSHFFYNSWRLKDTKINLDFGNCIWIRRNMCSIIGAIFFVLIKNGNEIFADNLRQEVEQTFVENGFLTDENNSFLNISNDQLLFKKIDSKDSTSYINYIKKGLLVHLENSENNDLLTNLTEIFLNIGMHSSNSEFVFISGTNAYKENALYFSITNIGETIKECISNAFKITKYDSINAINWAAVKGNTTRKDEESGGLGIPLLIDFALEHEGYVEIVSDDGYWYKSHKKTVEEKLYKPFPGTCISFKIKTSNEIIEDKIIEEFSIADFDLKGD